MLNKIITLLFILFLVSCNDNKNEETNSEKNNVVDNTSLKIISSIGEVLNPEARKLVKDWEEYKIVDEKLNDFYSITTDEALLKAKSLSISTQQLKDSIRIEQLDRPDIKIRLNVLYNSTLRLADMQTITNIEKEKVKLEISNILNAFSATNSKINNLTNQKLLEEQLIDFQNK